eukprot:CAMPEP_0119312804 /NCGR_PEP_ID=MMETSP1333-20130426/27021_1 /TAXON_ID=418940 /ORGANISM="Scyphosphaera apsteinii, Strain RCC1455" /LENGTH=516 /DNA_ID=CAMNT_0007317475 /DNA_START=132 /DNA_END=1682 /DNA_ORIENTATION=+
MASPSAMDTARRNLINELNVQKKNLATALKESSALKTKQAILQRKLEQTEEVAAARAEQIAELTTEVTALKPKPPPSQRIFGFAMPKTPVLTPEEELAAAITAQSLAEENLAAVEAQRAELEQSLNQALASSTELQSEVYELRAKLSNAETSAAKSATSAKAAAKSKPTQPSFSFSFPGSIMLATKPSTKPITTAGSKIDESEAGTVTSPTTRSESEEALKLEVRQLKADAKRNTAELDNIKAQLAVCESSLIGLKTQLRDAQATIKAMETTASALQNVGAERDEATALLKREQQAFKASERSMQKKVAAAESRAAAASSKLGALQQKVATAQRSELTAQQEMRRMAVRLVAASSSRVPNRTLPQSDVPPAVSAAVAVPVEETEEGRKLVAMLVHRDMLARAKLTQLDSKVRKNEMDLGKATAELADAKEDLQAKDALLSKATAELAEAKEALHSTEEADGAASGSAGAISAVVGALGVAGGYAASLINNPLSITQLSTSATELISNEVVASTLGQ